jgi:hypothetical protein
MMGDAPSNSNSSIIQYNLLYAEPGTVVLYVCIFVVLLLHCCHAAPGGHPC